MSLLFRYLLVLISFCLLSCFQQQSSRLDSRLEGTIVSLSDIFRIKCVLKTGESLNQKIDWTEAENVILEEKTQDGQYQVVKKSSIAYDGFDQKGKKAKGYINDFSYVSINSIEDKKSSFLPSVEDDDEAKVIQQGKLRCENLLTPEQHSFIIAKDHHSYDLEFQVIGNHLRALIIAAPEDLPFQALPYSIKISDTRYGMPIGGYDIGLGYLRESVNSDFEATRSLEFREIPIKNKDGQERKLVNNIPTIYPQGVKEIQVRGEFRPFKTLLESGGKKDVYPKKLFTGDWYYNNTVVATSLSQSRVNSMPFGYDHEYQRSNKISIVFKDKHLIAYSLNIEEGTPSSSNLDKRRFVFKIPIQHTSYEASTSLSGQIVNAGLDEVLNKREDDKDKDFVQIDFSKTSTPVSGSLNKLLEEPSFSLHELHLSEDYISFVLYDELKGAKIKYDLLRPSTNNTYTPLNVSQKSHNLFPAFYSQKRIHDNNLKTISKTYQDSYLVRRFNTNKPIVYRFSKITPKLKHVRDLGRESINLWNQVFQKAGIVCPQKDCFILDESKDVDLGDIRYNVFNLIHPQDLSGRFSWAGYGPSVSNFETGEVISATANMALNIKYNSIAATINHYIMDAYGLDASYWKALRLKRNGSSSYSNVSGLDFLKKQLFSGQLRKLFIPNSIFSRNNINGLNGANTKSGHTTVYGLNIDTSSVGQPIKFITSIDEIITTPEDRKDLAFQYLIATGEEPSDSYSNEKIYKGIVQSKKNNHNLHSCSLNTFEAGAGVGLAENNLVEVLCKEELKDLISSVDIKNSPHLKLDHLWNELRKEDVENKILNCVEKILPISSVNTITHETGHNISMYHNFAGSSDKDNFLELKDFKFDHILSHLKDDEKEALFKMSVVQPSSSTVMDYLGPQAVGLVPGRYDVDFVRFVYGGQLQNRLTKEFVQVDPFKMTDLKDNKPFNINHIRTFRSCNDYNLSSINEDPFCQVWDVGTTAQEILTNEHKISEYYYYTKHFLERSLPFYHKWRLELSRHLAKTSDSYYLSSIDTATYRESLKEFCTDPNHKLYDLCNASRFFIQTMMNNIFAPDHYCVVEYGYTKQQDRIAFKDLYKEIEEIEAFKSSRSSCEDFSNFLRLSGGYSLKGEVGKPVFDLNFSTNKNNKPLDTRYDRMGSYENRAYSALTFLISTLSGVTYFNGGNRPISVMDEPDIREIIHSRLEDRFLNGVSIDNKYSYNFSNEKTLLRFFSNILLQHKNITTSIGGIQNQIKGLVRLVPYSYLEGSFNEPSRIKTQYLEFYTSIRSQGGHVVDEPQAHVLGSNSDEDEPLLIVPFSSTSFLRSFIEGIRKIDFRRSVIELWDITGLWDTPDGSIVEEGVKPKRPTTPERFRYFTTKHLYEDVLVASVDLLKKEQVFNTATLVLLYDYLERGKDEDLITDDIIPFLQMMKISSLRLKLGLPKNIDPDISKDSESYLDIKTPQPDKFTYNPIRPNIKFFKDYFQKNPQVLRKSSKEILDIYLLELFKSSKYENSRSRTDLRSLVDEVVLLLEKEEPVAQQEVKEVETSVAQQEVKEVETSVTEEVEEEVATSTQSDNVYIDPSNEVAVLANEAAKLAEQASFLANKAVKKAVGQEGPVIKSVLNIEDENLSPADMLKYFNDTASSIVRVKKMKHYLHNKFLKEVLIRDLYGIYFLAPKQDLTNESILNNSVTQEIVSEMIGTGNYVYMALKLAGWPIRSKCPSILQQHRL